MYMGRALERLGDAALKEQEPDIGAAFLKFAVVTKELSALMKTLVTCLSHTIRLVQNLLTRYLRVTECPPFSSFPRDSRNILSLLSRVHPYEYFNEFYHQRASKQKSFAEKRKSVGK